MPLDRSDVESALLLKGFTLSETHHKFFTYHTTQGKKTHINTHTSHGTGYKNLGDDLVKAMSRQCGLTMPQFKQLVSCTLDRNAYQQILVQAGKITLDPPPQ
jgi:hypothetical protein